MKGFDKVLSVLVNFLSLKSCKIKLDNILSLIILKKKFFIDLFFLLFLEENKDIKEKDIIFQFNDFITEFKHFSISFLDDKFFKKNDIESLI